jgi:periplasmic copper chaperone A
VPSEVHSSINSGGSLNVKVCLKPESLHLMLVGLKQPLVKGEHVKATLEFAKSGKVDVDYAVGDIGAPGPSGGMGGMPSMPNMNQGH